MKKYKTEDIPSTTREVLTGTFCDMCKEEIECLSMYNVDRIQVSRECGEVYPEGGYTDKNSVDLCGKCFSEKLVPWLKSQGCEIETREIEHFSY